MDVIQMNMEELVPFVNAQEGEFFIRTFLGKEGEKRGEGVEGCFHPLGGGTANHEQYADSEPD